MLYFKTRDDARTFSKKKDHYTFIDNGADSLHGQRWGVRVLE